MCEMLIRHECCGVGAPGSGGGTPCATSRRERDTQGQREREREREGEREGERDGGASGTARTIIVRAWLQNTWLQELGKRRLGGVGGLKHYVD